MEPPTLYVKKLKDYKETDYDTPCVVIEDASCETVLPLIKDGIFGINRAGVISILNGAVPPTQSWMRYVYRQTEQPKNYVDMYPKQSWLLAEINEMLLRHAMSTRMKSVLTFKVGAPIDYAKIKLDLETQFGLTAEHFSDTLSLPTIRPMTPSFYTDPMTKYVWAMKVWQGKLNLKEEAFEYMLEVLAVEERSRESETVQYVKDVHDYSLFEKETVCGGPDIGAAGSLAAAQIPVSTNALPTTVERVLAEATKQLSTVPVRSAMEHVLGDVRKNLMKKI